MGCLVSSRKTAPLTSVSPSSSKLTTADCTEAPRIIQEKVVIMNFVRDDQPEDEEITGKSKAATTSAAASQAPICQSLTRKAENRKRTGLSSVAKPASKQTQVGLTTGMDLSLPCDFLSLSDQESPRFSKDLTEPGAKKSLSLCSLRSGYQDDSIDDVLPGLQGEPQASLAVGRQQLQQLIPLNTMSCSTRDKEEKTEKGCMETLKMVATTVTGGGDHVGGGEKATQEIERKLKEKQSQFHLLQPEGGGKKEDTVQPLFISEGTYPGQDSSDLYSCHLPDKPVTYRGFCSPTDAPEFYFSLEDILQQQLPCCPDVIELAATTGTDGGERLTTSISMPNTYNFNSSQNTDAQLK